MKTNHTPIDLKESCALYSDTIQKTLKNLFMIETDNQRLAQSVKSLEEQDDLYFSILFTGQIYGEFLIGLNKKTALKMLGVQFEPGQEQETYQKHRGDILDAFKEVVNIAAGTCLAHFKLVFPDLSITPPKAIEGNITLSNYEIEKAALSHSGGNLSCYLYIDYMKLDISQTLEKNAISLSEEKAKQEELKRLNKAKSEFLANMSHELRTPLNGMIGMLDMLKTSSLNVVQKEQFDIIYRSGEFLLSLISDILEFSKIESGKLEVEKQAFDLRACIEIVVENLASVVHQRGLDFNLQIDPQISGQYLGDETRLKQVLINLIGNAIKFTPTGSISVRALKTTEGRFAISVIDTGVGIPKDKMESIFASFSQVDVSDNRKYGGTGLGLTISRSIVQAMGGEIRVLSEEAQGSEFIIDLPLEFVQGSSTGAPAPGLNDKLVHVVVSDEILFQSIQLQIQNLNPSTQIKKMDQIHLVPLTAQNIVMLEFRIWQKLASSEQEALIENIRQAQAHLNFLIQSRDIEAIGQFQTKYGPANISYLNMPITSGRLCKVLLEGSQTAPATPVLREEPAAVTSNHKKVLVVEDNQVNQVVITAMLKKLGYEIELAGDGKQALDKIEAGNVFELILMDCQMPIMNGYEATAAIRKFEEGKNRHSPIIALTANAFRETKESCFECGMDDFATKPIKFETLKDLIKKTFDKIAA